MKSRFNRTMQNAPEMTLLSVRINGFERAATVMRGNGVWLKLNSNHPIDPAEMTGWRLAEDLPNTYPTKKREKYTSTLRKMLKGFDPTPKTPATPAKPPVQKSVPRIVGLDEAIMSAKPDDIAQALKTANIGVKQLAAIQTAIKIDVVPELRKRLVGEVDKKLSVLMT